MVDGTVGVDRVTLSREAFLEDDRGNVSLVQDYLSGDLEIVRVECGILQTE